MSSLTVFLLIDELLLLFSGRQFVLPTFTLKFCELMRAWKPSILYQANVKTNFQTPASLQLLDVSFIAPFPKLCIILLFHRPFSLLSFLLLLLFLHLVSFSFR